MWVKFYEGLFAGDVGKVLWRIVQRWGVEGDQGKF